MDGGLHRREGIKRGIYLLPSLCTTANLFCGFYSIVKSLHHEFVAAAWAIVVAGLFDFLDGRVARLAHAESEFGIEYDSLVDLASFGLAPGILIYTWSLAGFNKMGWLVAFLFFACGALRLARFNVQVDSVERTYFQGLPIPAAAYLVATGVIVYHHLVGAVLPIRSWIVLGVTVLLAMLMISTIRYRSFKQLDLRGRWSFFSLVFVVGGIFVIAAEPEISLFMLVCGFVGMGLIEEVVTMRKGRQVLARVRERRAARRERKMHTVLGAKVRSLHADEPPGESDAGGE
ncbi:MAG: CDP-diacylglycerol--serine O-phosphatidyltransferase [Deltaproteobacteria bacterium]|nr:CDP-diacylglycerol--serine O-phosphatidyltransferase [Deltaproteobacteria bacterium]